MPEPIDVTNNKNDDRERHDEIDAASAKHVSRLDYRCRQFSRRLPSPDMRDFCGASEFGRFGNRGSKAKPLVLATDQILTRDIGERARKPGRKPDRRIFASTAGGRGIDDVPGSRSPHFDPATVF